MKPQDYIEVARILERWRYDPWNMMGRHNRFARQELMSVLQGRKVPIAKCGVTALTDWLSQVYHLPWVCIADFPKTVEQAVTKHAEAAQMELASHQPYPWQ